MISATSACRLEPEITLDQVCARHVAIILGEPGSGKSTIAKAAVWHAVERGHVPLLGQLRSYAGDLSTLVSQTTPRDLVDEAKVDGVALDRVLVLDGFDEIPLEHLDRFVEDLERTLSSNSYTHIVLTSRQAFYASNRHRFRSLIDPFYLLGSRRLPRPGRPARRRQGPRLQCGWASVE